jgi:branched-chain amino acid transport system permease protein
VTPYIIAGLVTGSIYAISALGLVLTYSSSRVFNFAHGAIAYTVAVFYYWLHTRQGWSIAIAAPFTILVVAPLFGLLLYFILFRRLTERTPTVRLVSTVGLWVAIPALVRITFPWAKGEIFQPDGFVNNPSNPQFMKVFGSYVNTNQFVVIVTAVVVAIATTVVLRFTPLGLATRATVDQPRNASIAGINTEGVTAISWMIGVMLAGLAGVIFAPVINGLPEFQFTLLLVGSLVAVVIGRLTSLPLTFIGAIGVGILQQIWVKYQPDSGFFSTGISASIPFFVMLVFLIAYSVTGSGLRRESFDVDRRRSGGIHGDAPPLPVSHGWRRAAGPLVLIAAFVAIPVIFNDFWLGIITTGVALAIIFLSYTLVTGEGGMISLAQITFAGIGGFAAARLAAEAGFPVWLAIVCGALIALPFGLILSFVSLRTGDLYLALLTLGFALVIEQFVWTRPDYTNFGAGRTLGRPFGIGISDRGSMYALIVVVFLVVAFLVVNLKRSTAGLVYASIRSSESASSTSGISVVRAKMIVFSASALIAGFGGALYGSTVGTVTPTGFTVLIGIVWLAVIVTWGVRSTIGALLAGLLFAISPVKLSSILILVLTFVLGGFFVRFLLSKTYRKPLGAIAMALCVVIDVVGSVFLWNHVSNTDAVSIILVLLALAVTLILVLRFRRLEITNSAVRIVVPLVLVIVGVVVAVLLAGLDLGTSATEVPTMLFGLGAIGLAREPRGVLYDMVNRQRLRQFNEAERREEAVAVAAELEGVPG